jgi:hypothetical protein
MHALHGHFHHSFFDRSPKKSVVVTCISSLVDGVTEGSSDSDGDAHNGVGIERLMIARNYLHTALNKKVSACTALLLSASAAHYHSSTSQVKLLRMNLPLID